MSQMKEVRPWQAAIFATFMFVGAWQLNNEFREWENRGGPKWMPTGMKLLYELGGRPGIVIPFVVLGVLFATLIFRNWRR